MMRRDVLCELGHGAIPPLQVLSGVHCLDGACAEEANVTQHELARRLKKLESLVSK